MWPFKKKTYPDLAEIPGLEAEQWAVGQALYGGAPLVMRINTSLEPFRGHPDLHHQIGIAVQLNEPGPNGTPTDAEMEQLQGIEDLIQETFRMRGLAILAVVLTMSDMREFVLYTSVPEQIEAAFDDLQKQVTSHPITLMIQPDPKWETYEQFRGQSPA